MNMSRRFAKLLSLARARWCVGLLAGLAAAGCSRDEPLYPASGVVTLDGQPIDTGDILFVSLNGPRGPDSAKITGGKYELMTTAGKKRVEISASKIRPGGARGAEGEPVPEEYIPARYNTESQLSAEVTAGGSRTLDFELKSK
jgi:hypothetical protein